MYESEIYIKTVDDKLPEEVIGEFRHTLETIELRSILHWSEHCTECSMPLCFTTCDFYSPRIDGKCQRFVKGIEKVDAGDKNFPEILKIFFKNWGVLSSQGNSELFSTTRYKRVMRWDMAIAYFIHFLYPAYIKKKFAQKRYSVKKKFIKKHQNSSGIIPDAFLVEIFNPAGHTVDVNLTIRNEDEKYRRMPFQYRMELKPGYNKEIIPFDEIDKRIQSKLSYRISFIPDNIPDSLPLYFGITEFVKFKQGNKTDKKADKVKCVVWDLDNTIWEGILIEGGIEKLKLKTGIIEILEGIEERGILNSVASKNDYDAAMEAIKYFNLDRFFVYPKISWDPKSVSVKEIASDLNINSNTLLFVDDSAFERAEVQAVLPQVRVLDAQEYNKMLSMTELDVPVTKESKQRKQFYLEDSERKERSSSFKGDYFEFLRLSNIKLEILDLNSEYFSRVYELTQRTNQMNFSGTRYHEEDIKAIADNPDLDSYVLKCTDNFGDYGIIGFAIIKKSENRLIDLMFSCRIQSKRVEHAFITFCLIKYLKAGDFMVTYTLTDRNKYSAQVFNDFAFETVSVQGNVQNLRFPKEKEVLNDNIIIIS
jgi:FkbH-like protein